MTSEKIAIPRTLESRDPDGNVLDQGELVSYQLFPAAELLVATLADSSA